jgi:hypothetical protein
MKPPSDDVALIGKRILEAVGNEATEDILGAIELVKMFLTLKLADPTEQPAPAGERPRLH